MFNFSANHLTLVSIVNYDKCRVVILKDVDTNRCYKVYDYSKTCMFETDKLYKISGKVNSADRLYLVLENYKEDNSITNIQLSKSTGS